MKEFENNFYRYDEEKLKLIFYSDEFERLLSKCNIVLNDIEIDVETGDIYCYVNPLNFKRLSCKKFDKVLKEKVPYIQDVIIEEEYFILIFNVMVVELL